VSARENFWDYSRRVYRKPNVAETCLTLQNSYGLDVNLLLFACWHAQVMGAFTATTLQQALCFSRPWAEQVVQPLRAARTWMKSNAESSVEWETAGLQDFAALRQKIKAVELEAEKYQQYALESLVSRQEQSAIPAPPRHVAPREDARKNLLALIEASAVTLTGDIMKLLTILLVNVIDGLADD